MDVFTGNCDVHNKREVVTEIKLHNGQVILLCYPVLKDATRKIEHGLKELSDSLEDDRQTNAKKVA